MRSIIRKILLIWSISPSEVRRSFTLTCIIATLYSVLVLDSHSAICPLTMHTPGKYLNLALRSSLFWLKVFLCYLLKFLMLSPEMTILLPAFLIDSPQVCLPEQLSFIHILIFCTSVYNSSWSLMLLSKFGFFRFYLVY